MLKTAFFLISLLLSVGLVMAFGFKVLLVCFGLCLLTVVLSSTGVEEVETDPHVGTQPAALAR